MALLIGKGVRRLAIRLDYDMRQIDHQVLIVK